MFEVSKEVLDTHEALLTVEVDEQTMKKEMQKAARDLSRRLSIPGFRKGKVPYHVMVRRVGEDALRREVADNLIQEIYPQIIEQAEIDPYASGGLDEVEINPLTYKIRIPLRPEVELGDYRELRVTSEETDVTEEEVEEALEEIRREQAVIELVERPAHLGDEVQLRVSGEVGDVVLVDRERISLALEEDTIYITPGFVEAILGMAPGEEKTFTLTLDEEFEDEGLRGQDATFSVKLFEVYDRKLPELDDALASVVGPFETLAELRDALRERMVNYKQAQTQEEYVNKLVGSLLDYAHVKYPPEMVDDEVERMVEEVRTSLQNEQGLGLEDALRLQGQTLSQLQESLRPRAEQRLEISLVMSKFIEQEKLEVTPEHIQEKMREAAPGAEEGLETLDFNSPFTRRLYQNVLSELAFERLERIAQGELEAEVEDAGIAPEPGAIIDVDAVEAKPEGIAEAQSEPERAEDAEDETPLAASEDNGDEVPANADIEAASDITAESEGETSASDSET